MSSHLCGREHLKKVYHVVWALAEEEGLNWQTMASVGFPLPYEKQRDRLITCIPVAYDHDIWLHEAFGGYCLTRRVDTADGVAQFFVLDSNMPSDVPGPVAGARQAAVHSTEQGIHPRGVPATTTNTGVPTPPPRPTPPVARTVGGGLSSVQSSRADPWDDSAPPAPPASYSPPEPDKHAGDESGEEVTTSVPPAPTVIALRDIQERLSKADRLEDSIAHYHESFKVVFPPAGDIPANREDTVYTAGLPLPRVDLPRFDPSDAEGGRPDVSVRKNPGRSMLGTVSMWIDPKAELGNRRINNELEPTWLALEAERLNESGELAAEKKKKGGKHSSDVTARSKKCRSVWAMLFDIEKLLEGSLQEHVQSFSLPREECIINTLRRMPNSAQYPPWPMHQVGPALRCKPFPLTVPLTRGIQCDRETTAKEWLYHLIHHVCAAVRIHEQSLDPLAMPHDVVFLIQKLSAIQKEYHHRRQAVLAQQYLFFLCDLLPDSWQRKVRKIRDTCLELQLAEVRAMEFNNKAQLYAYEEEAHASVGSCPPAPPPVMDPSNLANGQHQIWGDSGSCVATPHQYITVGSQVTQLEGEWKTRPSTKCLGPTWGIALTLVGSAVPKKGNTRLPVPWSKTFLRRAMDRGTRCNTQRRKSSLSWTGATP